MAEKKGSTSEKTLYCSFCGKSQHEVKKLIAGPSVFICDECIDLCNDIIRDELPASTVREGRGDLPTPIEIKTNLDNYVIGQEPAKRALSVAVYNHYKRLQHKLESKKDDVELSKSTNKNNEYIKATRDVTKAHNFIALTWVLGIPKIIKIPINGINISHDKIKSNIINLVLR